MWNDIKVRWRTFIIWRWWKKDICIITRTCSIRCTCFLYLSISSMWSECWIYLCRKTIKLFAHHIIPYFVILTYFYNAELATRRMRVAALVCKTFFFFSVLLQFSPNTRSWHLARRRYRGSDHTIRKIVVGNILFLPLRVFFSIPPHAGQQTYSDGP